MIKVIVIAGIEFLGLQKPFETSVISYVYVFSFVYLFSAVVLRLSDF